MESLGSSGTRVSGITKIVNLIRIMLSLRKNSWIGLAVKKGETMVLWTNVQVIVVKTQEKTILLALKDVLSKNSKAITA